MHEELQPVLLHQPQDHQVLAQVRNQAGREGEEAQETAEAPHKNQEEDQEV